MKVCVLGVTGFLGSAIAQVLTKNGITWVGVSSSESSHPNIKTIKRFDTLELVRLINEFPVVINVTGSLKPKDFELNTEGSLAYFCEGIDFLSNVFSLSKISSLIQISSAGTVYGEVNAGQANTETSQLKPISWYGRAKQFEELAFGSVANNCDFNYLCLRVTNPFGNPHRTTHGFVDVLVHCAKNNIPFSYYKDCNPFRDFVYAEDMANSIIKLMLKDEAGTFNIGSGESISLRSIVKYVRENWQFDNLFENLVRPDSDVITSAVNVSKLKASGCYVKTVDVYSYIDKKLNITQKL